YSIEKKAEPFHHISKLTVKDINISDNRSYICQFQNSHGKASATTVLFVQDPPEVELNLVESLGPEELKVEWTVHSKDSSINSTEIVISNDDLGEIPIEVKPESETSIILQKEDLLLGSDEVPSSFQVFVRVVNDNGIAESDVVNVTMLK
ncbi:hypothetical protein Anas_11211, partial [Armadillidium nasatum]